MEPVEITPPANQGQVDDDHHQQHAGAAARRLLQEAAVYADGLARVIRGLEDLCCVSRGPSAQRDEDRFDTTVPRSAGTSGTAESAGGEGFARLIAHSRLTHREADVLHLLLQGSSNRRISRTLRISEPTVKNHMHAIFLKLDVTDRTQAIAKAHRLMRLSDPRSSW